MTPTSSDKPGPLPAAAPAEVPPPRADHEEEVDIWWGAYSIRTMVPTFILCGILTAGIILLAVLLWEEAHPQVIWHATMGLVIAVWIYALARCAYRMAALNYRLTTHHLFRDRGFRQPDDGVVLLARVRQVVVERNAWEQLLGIGKVRILADHEEPLVLEGVRHPEVIAEEIRLRVEHARKRK